MAGPVYTLRLRSRDEIDAIRERGSQWARRVLLEALGLPTDEPPEAERGRAMRAGEPDPWGTGDEG